jgi:DNA-binding transcriptional ArsR family regulator
MRQRFCCKTGEMIYKYEFDRGEIDDTVAAKWRGEDGHTELSINDVGHWFNKQILTNVYQDHGRSTPEYKVDAEYEVLADDDVPEHKRAELVSELEADGIDVDELTDHFVSYSTVYRHLRECIGAEKNTDDNTDSDWERDGIEVAKDNFQTRVIKSLRALSNKDRLAGYEDSELEFSAHLRCDYCPTSVPVETVIDRGYVCATHNDLNTVPDVSPSEVVSSFLT